MKNQVNRENFIKLLNSTVTLFTAILSAAGAFLALISGIVGLITAGVTLAAVQGLSIPEGFLTVIIFIISIIAVSAVVIIALTIYLRYRTRLASTIKSKLREKEQDLFQEIENQITSLIAEKVQS